MYDLRVNIIVNEGDSLSKIQSTGLYTLDCLKKIIGTDEIQLFSKKNRI